MPPNARFRTLAYFCFAIFAVFSMAEVMVFTPGQQNQLVDFINHLMECRGIVGATVAVVRGNESWTRGFGWEDRENMINATSSTLFGIGSCTKAFTTALLSQFIDKNDKISWDSKISDILKDFALEDDYVSKQVTIRDLLLHRTGLTSTNLPLFAGLPNMTRDEFARRMKYLPTSFPFRDKMVYNNWMYGLVGHVAEIIDGGTTYEDLLETRIFKPLGMSASRVIGRSVRVGDVGLAKPYVQVDNASVLSDYSIYNISPQEAAGAIASSADDMAKWLKLLINKGRNENGTQVLGEKRLQEMMTSGIRIETYASLWLPQYPVTFDTNAYGYAWFTGSYRGYKTIYHTGGFFAYATLTGLLPDFNLGVFVSTNGLGNTNASRFIRLILNYIADLIILQETEEPWLNKTTACEFPAPWQPPDEQNDTSIKAVPDDNKIFVNTDRYLGTYGHYMFGEVKVTLNGTGNLTATYNRLYGQLRRIKYCNDTVCNTTQDETTTLMEMSGGFDFLSKPAPNTVLYLNFSFARPKNNDQFEELHLSAPEMAETNVLVFQRGVTFGSPPPPLVPPSGCTNAAAAVVADGVGYLLLILLGAWVCM